LKKTSSPTIFIDLGGTILDHMGGREKQIASKPVALDGVVEKFSEWHEDGYRIIIVTGRPEEMREITEKQLQEVGISYDQIIMDVGSGQRILINDLNGATPDVPMAVAINVKKNEGLKDIEL